MDKYFLYIQDGSKNGQKQACISIDEISLKELEQYLDSVDGNIKTEEDAEAVFDTVLKWRTRRALTK